ncbi:MAG: LacI family DNA-binding transcriptional regulator [Trueperaceae bacterium]
MGRPTIKDVAAEVGVSAQAVSLVINEKAGVSEDTRKAILAAIRKLDYTPRAWAQAMRGGETRTLGFIYAGTRHGRLSASGYLEEILNGALAAGNRRGYHLLLYSLQLGELQGGGGTGLVWPKNLLGRVDGLVTVVSDLSEPHLDALEELGLPVVEIQRENENAYTVCANDEGGLSSAVGYLVRRGHTRIAYLSRALSTYTSRARHSGYLKGLADHGLEYEEELTLYAEHGKADTIVITEHANEPAEITQGHELTLELLRRRNPPTALICFDDLLALGALRAARSRSVRVPEDLAVIGFNNFSVAAAVDPPLTTIEFPAYDLGARAADLIIDHLQEKPITERHVTLPVTLVTRSTA